MTDFLSSLEGLMPALGTRLKASEESKKAFIDAILTKLVLSEVEAEAIFREDSKALLTSAEELCIAVEKFQELAESTFESSRVKSCALKKAEVDSSIFKQMLAFISTFKTEVKARTAKPKGPDNMRELVIARMIAVEYYRHFGHLPDTGNNEFIGSCKTDGAPKRTPYDRVCDIIEKKFSPKGVINPSTRKKAIESLKIVKP